MMRLSKSSQLTPAEITNRIKKLIKGIPVIGQLIKSAKKRIFAKPFQGSEKYWIERYKNGKDSGCSSYGKYAKFKAETLNNFVREQHILTVIEYGCGDGNQLRYANYNSYLGFEVSPKSVTKCRKIFDKDTTKKFKLIKDYNGEKAELVLSLDTLFHLVEDEVFELYMQRLFNSSDHFVVIYSTNTDDQGQETAPHVRHRKFSAWIEEHCDNWKLIRHIPDRNTYIMSDGTERVLPTKGFYIYEKVRQKA